MVKAVSEQITVSYVSTSLYMTATAAQRFDARFTLFPEANGNRRKPHLVQWKILSGLIMFSQTSCHLENTPPAGITGLQ